MGNEITAPANNPSPKGNIKIEITSLSNVDDIDLNIKGYRRSVVDDDDCVAFRMTNYKLKKAVEAYHGRKPTDVFVKSPTLWGDLYTKHSNWYPVEKIVSVVSAEVTDVECTRKEVAVRRFINNSEETGNFNASFTETASNTVTSSWSEEYSLSTGISYTFDFPCSANLQYTAKCGTDVSRSKAVTIAAQSGVNVTLGPGRSVIARLTSIKKKITVEVEYEIELEGDVVCNYEGGYKNHTFWAFDVNDVLKAADKPTVLHTSETLELTYYSDGEIILDSINQRRSTSDDYCSRYGVRDYNLY